MTTTQPLPKTWKLICSEFPGKSNHSLREKIFRMAQRGQDVTYLLHLIAFSNSQMAAKQLSAINETAQQERQ